MSLNPCQPSRDAAALPKDRFRTTLTAEQAARRAAAYFTHQNYRLEPGCPFDGLYGMGNDFPRIFFGALAKRYKFKVRISPIAGGSVVDIEKGILGILGGLIGVAALDREYKRVLFELSTSLPSH